MKHGEPHPCDAEIAYKMQKTQITHKRKCGNCGRVHLSKTNRSGAGITGIEDMNKVGKTSGFDKNEQSAPPRRLGPAPLSFKRTRRLRLR